MDDAVRCKMFEKRGVEDRGEDGKANFDRRTVSKDQI